MKKGFTVVEIIFLLIIVISFSIIIFETETDMTAIENASAIQDFNGSKAP